MKNLANCKPSEFVAQTVKIKRAVENWLTKTDIMNIRKRMPALAENLTKKEREKAAMEQARANISAMFDEIMEKHPKETLDLLALLCFVEPEHVDDYPMGDYLASITEMIGSDAVIGFFTSLAKLGQIDILRLSRA